MKKILILFGISFLFLQGNIVQASYHFSNYKGKTPIHFYGKAMTKPNGLSPAQIKNIYNLPASGGKGTIVIVGAYDDKNIEKDLNNFSLK